MTTGSPPGRLARGGAATRHEHPARTPDTKPREAHTIAETITETLEVVDSSNDARIFLEGEGGENGGGAVRVHNFEGLRTVLLTADFCNLVLGNDEGGGEFPGVYLVDQGGDLSVRIAGIAGGWSDPRGTESAQIRRFRVAVEEILMDADLDPPLHPERWHVYVGVNGRWKVFNGLIGEPIGLS